jgi:hypothetical protein
MVPNTPLVAWLYPVIALAQIPNRPWHSDAPDKAGW